MLETGNEHGESGGRERNELSLSFDKGIMEECLLETGVEVINEHMEGFVASKLLAEDWDRVEDGNGIDMVGVVIAGLGGGDDRNSFLSSAVFCAEGLAWGTRREALARGTRRSLKQAPDKSGIVKLVGMALLARTLGEKGVVNSDLATDLGTG